MLHWTVYFIETVGPSPLLIGGIRTQKGIEKMWTQTLQHSKLIIKAGHRYSSVKVKQLWTTFWRSGKLTIKSREESYGNGYLSKKFMWWLQQCKPFFLRN